MPLCDVHWFSEVLQKHVGTYVILPKVGKPPFPTYYLLHGLSDDYTGWIRRSRIESYLKEVPLIVVMPDGFRGFYTDNDAGPAYGQYIGEELIQFVERNFPAKRSRAGRSIGGLSMGGYGALRLALENPDRFAAANSHSGALMYGARNGVRKSSPLTPLEQRHIFGPRPAGSAHDLLSLATQASKAKQIPKLQIDCGTEDSLIEDSRTMHEHLAQLGIAHEYSEYPGEHDWDYWDGHIRDALRFHGKVLGVDMSTLRKK